MLLFNLAQGLKKNLTMTLKWANKFFALNIFGACNRGKCLLFLKLKIKRNCKKYDSFVQIKKYFFHFGGSEIKCLNLFIFIYIHF